MDVAASKRYSSCNHDLPEQTGQAYTAIIHPPANVLSPYGIAIFILFLAVSRNFVNDLYIFGIFLIVMLLNLATMRYARGIVRRGGTLLAILGAVIGVLLVALSVQMILDALRFMQVLPTP